MNNKNIKIFTLILAIGAVGWSLLPTTSEHVVKMEEQVIEKEPVSLPVKKVDKSLIIQSIGDYLASPAHADPAIIKRIQKIKRFQDLQTGEFNYFGKVIDQHGEPVMGAKITGYYSYYPLIPNGDFTSSSKGFERVSDANGLFSILDKKGISIRIGLIEKEGYEFEKSRLYMFDRGGIKMLKEIGNPDKPVIFKAWEKTEAEHLVSLEKRVYLSFDGQKIAVDLHVKSCGAQSDFTVSVIRSGSRINPADWQVVLEVAGGGLIESSDLFMNLAPESGYQSKVVISNKRSDENYTSQADKKYFLKSKNGKSYASLEMQIRPFFNNSESAIFMKYRLNPNGSRNLQNN